MASKRKSTVYLYRHDDATGLEVIKVWKVVVLGAYKFADGTGYLSVSFAGTTVSFRFNPNGIVLRPNSALYAYIDGYAWSRFEIVKDGKEEAEAKEAVIADAQSHYDMMVGGLTEDLERIKREFAPEETNDVE